MGKHSNLSGNASDSAPWWLDDTGESCPHCLQGYPYGLHYHCIACDGAICALCVVSVRVRREFYCPGCEEELEEKE